jgi:hypothetical protein
VALTCVISCCSWRIRASFSALSALIRSTCIARNTHRAYEKSEVRSRWPRQSKPKMD